MLNLSGDRVSRPKPSALLERLRVWRERLQRRLAVEVQWEGRMHALSVEMYGDIDPSIFLAED